MNAPKELNCPTCKKVIYWTEAFPYRPFCSHRCQLIDLGEWASEGYAIPASSEEQNKKNEWE